MRITFDPTRIEDYRTFLKVRQLPTYRMVGRTAEFPNEYAAMIGEVDRSHHSLAYEDPPDFLFDYQRDITRIALTKRKFCVFADCGLGKTLILLEFVRVTQSKHRTLIVSPLMVIPQTLAECKRFYGDSLPIEHVKARDLSAWLEGSGGIGITNFEALNKIEARHKLGCLVIDESSMLKGHYGKWGKTLVQLGRGTPFKLCLTGTPAPNDRIEFAQHAVLMDAFPTINSFLARYFINRGQTENRWEIKPHAIGAFYRDLSHWCIFLSDPATYGWKAHAHDIPPIEVHMHDVPLTAEQKQLTQSKTGELFVTQLGGIASRAKLATLSKGFIGRQRIATNKTGQISGLVASWPTERTIVWCIYNEEQRIISEALPEAESIYGETPYDERHAIIGRFKSGETRTLITKPKILGYGLNLQHVTRQVFSGLQDSYESYYQAVKRSNRYGSTQPLHVHIPMTDIERPMVENVLRKAARVQQDTEEQERIFKANAPYWQKLAAN